MSPAARPDAPEPLRRNRDFWLLWTGVGLATLGNTVTTVAYPLLMIWEEGSAASAGVVGFAGLLPLLLLQLPAGVFVDRWDRRRTMIACNVACGLATTSLCVALLCGRLWLPHVAAVAFVETSAFVFYRLAEHAAVRAVVHPDHLPAAMSQNQARGRGAGLLGQATGSSLFALVRWAPFVFTAVTHMIAVVNLLLIRKPFQTERRGKPRRLHAEVAAGIGWLFHQRFLRTAILLVAVTNILFNALRLAVVLIVKDGGGSSAVMGVVGVIGGVGGVAGALIGPLVLRRTHPGMVIVGVFAVWSVTMPLVSLTANPVLLGLMFALMLLAASLINVVAGVYQVQVTPDDLQGRVGSVASLLSSGANSLGPLIGGVLLGAFGGPATVLWLSAVMVTVTVVAALSPPLRQARLDRSALPDTDRSHPAATSTSPANTDPPPQAAEPVDTDQVTEPV